MKVSHTKHLNCGDQTKRKGCSSTPRGERSWMAAVAIITISVASACATLPSEQMTPTQIMEPKTHTSTMTTTPKPNMPATYTAVAAETLDAMLTLDTTTKPQVTSTPYTIPKGFQLSVPVYFHSYNQRAVWRLDPQAVALERVSPSDWQVTAFDVSSTDGRTAYGTWDGKLILALAGMEPTTILDLREETEFPLFIRSLAWSPEGNQLAYAVHLQPSSAESGLEEEKMSGIWVWDLEEKTKTHLLRNEYFPEDGDINKLVAFSHPVWSPDGTGMIVTGHYWEWINTLWLDPIKPDLDRSNLKNPLEYTWGDATWTLDGRSILVSGLQYASTCDLYRVDRETLVVETLIDGKEEGIFIFLAQELPEGIAFVSYDEDFEPRLYIGKQSGNGLVYEPAGPDDPLCTSVAVNSVVWDKAGRYALVSCHRDRRLLSLDGSLDIDLDLYLGLLVNEDNLDLYWGFDLYD